MKNIFKLAGIIGLAAIIGFSFAACGGGAGDPPGGGKTDKASGTAVAMDMDYDSTDPDDGEIKIYFTGDDDVTCTLTTSSPTVNAKIDLVQGEDFGTTISGLTPGAEITWQATVVYSGNEYSYIWLSEADSDRDAELTLNFSLGRRN